MQRGGAEAARGPGGKRAGGRRGAARRVLSVVCSPLAAVALFAALLLYSSHRFAHLASSDATAGEGGFFDGRSRGAAAAGQHHWQQGGGAGGGTADPHQVADAASGHSTGGDMLADLKQQAQQQPQHRSSWLSAALLWAEEHHAARTRAKASVYQAPTGCGLLPCQGQQLQRPRTLVLYVYNAADAEQQRNFEHFMRSGVEEQSWLSYRIVLASGTGILPVGRLPALPRNAAYVRTSRCTTGVWGILSAVASDIEKEVAAAEHILVVTAAARGPFMPPYTKQYMHWTDAFTSKLTKRTKLVGSTVTCEGAPRGGDAADEWRRNPFVLPYAWAIDKEGWQLLSKNEEVFTCHSSPWDARYYADSGASLALLSAGYNIDTLLSKYQGVDWWNQRTWDCNARVRPDAEWTYDGISISPYETVFVPVSLGPAQSDWSYVRQAVKYSAWHEAQTSGTPQGNSNAFVSDAWTLRAPRMVFANSRGPGCFDFDFYVQHNPDMHSKASMHQLLWEHYVLVGQFQGRPHRFTCPVQIGSSYRASYTRARGRRCFDHNHYSKHNQDLRFAGIGQAYELFNHYADFGQFENRIAKFVCSDSLFGLPKGFDTRPLDPIPKDEEGRNAEKWAGLVKGAAEEAEAGLARLEGGAAGAGGSGQQQQQVQQQQVQQAAAMAEGHAATAEQQVQTQTQVAEQQAQAAGAAAEQQAAAAAAAEQQAQAAAAVAARQQAQAAAAAAAATDQAAAAQAAGTAVGAADQTQAAGADMQAAAQQGAAAAAAAIATDQAAAAQAAGAALGAADQTQAAGTGMQAAAQQGAAADGAAGAAGAAVQQAGAAAGAAGQAGTGGGGAEAVGDAADAVAFGRLEESEVEAFQRQEAMQEAAGGG
ncbi:hypothetical protein ABPG75_008381 [Micractinium tetrahymenae]